MAEHKVILKGLEWEEGNTHTFTDDAVTDENTITIFNPGWGHDPPPDRIYQLCRRDDGSFEDHATFKDYGGQSVSPNAFG